MDHVSAILQRTGRDLGKWDRQRQHRTLGDITEGALDPTGDVSPNVSCFRWEDLANHPSLMVGPEADGLRFLLCPRRSTAGGTVSRSRTSRTEESSGVLARLGLSAKRRVERQAPEDLDDLGTSGPGCRTGFCSPGSRDLPAAASVSTTTARSTQPVTLNAHEAASGTGPARSATIPRAPSPGFRGAARTDRPPGRPEGR